MQFTCATKMNASSRTFARTVFFLLFGILFIGKTHPTRFAFLNTGLDPSWAAALGFANRLGLQYGSDIVFTMGPLVGLFNHQFDEKSALIVLAISVLRAGFYAAALSALAIRSLFTGMLALIVLSSTVLASDTIAFGIPLLMVCLTLSGPQNTNLGLILLGSLLCAASTLGKFSAFPVSIACILLVDLLFLNRRRFPLATIAYVLSLVGLFLLFGQSIGGLASYFRAAIEISGGYAAAMSIPGRPLELGAFIAIATIFGGLILFDANRSYLSGKSTVLSSCAIGLAIVAFVFISFKAGFVRHDLHSLIGWGSLVLAATLFALTRRPVGIVIAIICIIPGHLLTSRTGLLSYPIDAFQTGFKETFNLVSVAMNPRDWLRENSVRLQKSAEALRNQYLLPILDGSVDTIPSMQSTVIANELKYHPRPVFQEYSTYSPSLIARNRVFFQNRAPDNLIMSPGSIDGRHPASAEGALWPLILSAYEPAERSKDILILKKRDRPLPSLLGPGTTTHSTISTNIPIPEGLQFLSIELELDWLGRTLNLLFRPPIATMTVVSTNGERVYRLIPGMISEGQLISPTIENSSELLMLFSGSPPSDRPSKLRVEAAFGYSREISATFRPLLHQILESASRNNSVIATEKRIAAQIGALVSSNQMRPPVVQRSIEGLFAHAPATLSLPARPGALKIGFGIREGAWKGQGDTDGVCFIVRSKSDTLFQRCLEPKVRVADRGEQEAIVQVPSHVNDISLETTCKNNCAYDWSYWSAAVQE